MRHKTRAIATSSFPVQRIVEDRSGNTSTVAGSALPQTKHIPMQLARVTARTDRGRGVQLHREAWALLA